MNDIKIVATSIGLCYKNGDELSFLAGMEDLASGEEASNDYVQIDEFTLNSTLDKYMDPNKSRRIDRVSKMGIVASQKCLRDSELSTAEHKDDVGVVICTTFGAVASSKDFMLTAIEKGELNASPLIFPYTVPNAATGTLTIEAALRGFNTTISGFNPICYAMDLLKLNRAKAFLAGGIEELTLENHNKGDKAKSLLDTNYKIGEGAAIILLTTADFAKQQNLQPLFEICSISTSYSLNKESLSIDNFDRIDSSTIKQSMSDAIKSSRIQPADVAAIVSLTFSSDGKRDDELKAVHEIWGKSHPPILYPKDVIGETFGASDTFNLVVGYSQLKNEKEKIIISNSHQIGGNVSSTIIKVL